MDVLAGGHGYHDRDVDRTPEKDAGAGGLRQTAGAAQAVASHDKKQHRDPDTPDIGVDAEDSSEGFADEQAYKKADGE